MYTFSPMMVANSRKHHCRVRPYTREVLVISTNLDKQKNHYPLDFRNRRGDEARIKNTWYNQGYCRDHMYCTHGQQVPPEALALTLSWFKEAKGIDVLMLLTMDLGTGEGTVRVSRRFDDKEEAFRELALQVFQKEVENQLGKTIKSLRSDRRGEYMSQEFLDHLKEHGIIAHRTPPYMPQNNGVSAGRNRTLLDMVRSMMSQTTLPKSFWYYALETAARILNMVH
ncbi:retrotransposon protein, putative, ty1-copia subclass [Tanacetum coccineum]